MLLNGVFKIKSIRQWADEAREKKTPEKFESQARKRCPGDGSELGDLTLAGIVFVFFSACARQGDGQNAVVENDFAFLRVGAAWDLQ